MDNRDAYARLVEGLGQLLVDHIGAAAKALAMIYGPSERHYPEASRFAAIKTLGVRQERTSIELLTCSQPTLFPPSDRT